MEPDKKIDDKVYSLGEKKKMSMRDLLETFSQQPAMRVTDLHLKVASPPTYRINGRLQKMNGPPMDRRTIERLAESILTNVELSHLQKNRSVDSSYITEALQFRVNCFYDKEGLAIAVRALEAKPPAIEEIGFPNRVWQDIVSRQWGLVLVTGITGAGKSTTIASLINYIADHRPCRVITLEDPIEYRLSGEQAVISQREVGRDVQSFERGLRDALREDPDVIFVGEMRDRESARWTLTAAETGHLVFSTLHTRDAVGSITRIIDMFPANQQEEIASQLSLGLSHIICQKLVPRSQGRGRVIAMEILNNTYAIANLIRLRKMEQVRTHLQIKTKDVSGERMITLERSLANLVRSGTVEPLEAEKWANDPNAFLDEMQREG
jgi:twitching motility protein PilT